MSNSEIYKFVDYLDSYKKTENIPLMDIQNLVYSINMDYYKNKYFLPFYVGNAKTYKIYNQNHIPFQNQSLLEPRPILVKTPVHIHTDIHSLSDLLHIIQTYEYKETEEYNLDLKSLHNIREELQQIHDMIGMNTLKTSILNQLLYFLQNLHVTSQGSSDFKHTVIYGPPGTGKTEIAKLIGKMYSKIGILPKNVFKKVTRGDLVAGYLGQTAIKTKNVIAEALGGVLFIDEAYSLSNGKNDLDVFSKECIDTLCEALSDHKNNLMVIVAGYEEELNECFFSSNRGLESRFIWRFKIEQYNAPELCQIFMKKVHEIQWSLDSQITPAWFEKHKTHFTFFGRDMELLLSYVKITHSRRVFGNPDAVLRAIDVDDLNGGLALFIGNRKEKKNTDFLHSLYV